jgi:cytochrome c oxidase subunit 1
MLNALAFVGMFVIGGLSGIFMAATPVDMYFHNTYFIVAHIHYVLFMSSIFGIFAGVYYWYPKMFGRMMNETWGKIHFVITFVSANAAFYPMHLVGMAGQPRRYAMPVDAPSMEHLQGLNTWISVWAIIMGFAQFIFVANVFISLFAGKKASRNPWKANTLEWGTPSPPGHGNFEKEPLVVRGPYEYSGPESLPGEDYAPQAPNLDVPEAVPAHAH